MVGVEAAEKMKLATNVASSELVSVLTGTPFMLFVQFLGVYLCA